MRKRNMKRAWKSKRDRDLNDNKRRKILKKLRKRDDDDDGERES